MQATTQDPSRTAHPAEDVTRAITAFTEMLARLQESHRRLEERAERVEAELCRANEALGAKVAELDRVKQHLEAVLAAIPSGVVVYDAAGQPVRANGAAAELLGCAPAAVLEGAGLAVLERTPEGGASSEVLCADGRVRVLARRRSPIRLAESGDGGAVEILDDRTELVRAQERLHRLDKTAALGTMAGGIAHEIRNPLHAIQGFAELLVREAAGDGRATRHATRIRAGVAEIEAIVASMLGLAGNADLAVETFPLGPLVDEAVAAARAERTAGERWAVELDVPALQLRADRIKVRQALRNLVANAMDVQPEGGVVRVAARPVADAVEFTVSDDGPGVPAADAHRICDPFFTTRAQGTGLGLALVQRVAELHGGSLDLVEPPRPLGGAAFALRVPGARTPIESRRLDAPRADRN